MKKIKNSILAGSLICLTGLGLMADIYSGGKLMSGFSEKKTLSVKKLDATDNSPLKRSSSQGVLKSSSSSNVETAADDAIIPPFIVHFDTQSDFDQFSVIDGNGDGVVWDIISFMHNLRISYNSQVAMDDWVVTPGLYLEAGKAYRVSALTMAGNYTDTERIEVLYGEAPTAEALVIPLIPPTELLGSDYVEISEYITPSKTGIYYIGFHGISDPDTYQLHLDEISVEAGISAMVPGVPTDLTAVPDAHGEYKATISAKAPTVTFSGEELTGTMTMEIKRDNAVIYRASNVMPGETVRCNDNLTKGVRVTYSAYAMNGEGSGNSTSVNVHIGYSFPAAVEEVKLTENTDNPGEITLSWPEVTLDDNGLIYPQGAVSYLIYVPGDYGWNLTYRDIMEPEYTFRAVPEGQQTFVSYAVCGLSEGGQGDFAFTGLQAVGSPFKGFSESFPDGSLSYPMIMETLAQKGMDWAIYSDASGVESQDKDNGFLGAKASGIGDISSITSPKVSLSGIDSPILSFYTYNIKGTAGEKDINSVAVEVREPGAAYARVMESSVYDLCKGEEGWGRVNVDLSDYAGKTVQFRIVAECKIFDLTLFDNIRLGQGYAKDLSVFASAPSKVATGEKYKVNGYVRNEGYLDASGFKVRLITEGAEPAESLLECTQLKAGDKYEFEYECILHPLQEKELTHRVEVIMDGDANEENNLSETLSIHPILSTLPAVTNLRGEANADGIVLAWDEPDLTGKRSVEKVDDFETAASWSRELEGWTFIDRDGSPVGGFQGMTLPGIDQQSLQSFFVFDSTLGNSSFEAHSGIKYLGSLFRSDQGTVDDWAISPELTGEAQTISFFAKSYSGTFAERIEILYSTGSLNPEDFVKLSVVEKVPSDWTRYEASLPEGAMHFAIRSCGTDTFMLMLDDFTYEVAEETSGLTVEGYNLYRNGVLVNESPLKDKDYLDSTSAEGKVRYVVTALYEKGESRGSNEFILDLSGVDEINSDTIVLTGDGKIILKNACGERIRVIGTDGAILYDRILSGDDCIYVSPGVYLVDMNGQGIKLIIR